MHALRQDLRFAWRTLAKTPVVTVVVVLSLALGIGANTAIFTIVNALLAKSLPVDRPEELVLYSEGRSRGFISGQSGQWNIFSYPLYRRLRDEQKSFAGVAAFRTMLDRLSLRPEGASDDTSPQVAWGRLVSGNYFSVLGVRAFAGRMLTAEDENLAAPPVAVLSFDYWRRRFDRSPGIVGRVLKINNVFATVAGVAPPEFFGESLEDELADVWLPVTLQPRIMPRESVLENAETNWLNLIGRLRPGVTRMQAQTEANVIFQQFLWQWLGANPSRERQEELRRNRMVMTPGGGGVSRLRWRYSRPLHILLALVGFVLLITCANVANMLLARAAAREKEVSMRLALGAGRSRLFRQFLTESLLLAGLGAALGLLACRWMTRLLVASVSAGERVVPLNVAPDVRFVGFALSVGLLAGILFGLAPALRMARVDLWTALKGSRAGSITRSRSGLAKSLAVAQIALSLPLLVGAGLFLGTLRELRSQDFGFVHAGVLEVGIDPGIAGYKSDQLENLYRALLSRVNALPGVRVASLSLYSPMSGNNWSGGIEVEGYTPPPKQQAFCQWVWVGPRYVETLGIPLLAGRDLREQDSAGSPKAGVVNESFVRRYFAGRSPLGRHFVLRKEPVEIVGVVKDFKFNDARQEMWPVAFLPLVQSSFQTSRYASALEVRTTGDPARMAPSVREALKQADRNLPVTGIKTLSRQVDDVLSRERLIAGLSSFFAALALLLACIGVYGVLAYAVARRTPEIGVRMALGARRGDILRMVAREALLLALAGAFLGLLVSLALGRAVSSQLYGLKANDPLTLGGAALLLVAAAVFAGFLPARRAARVDPMTTLRAE